MSKYFRTLSRLERRIAVGPRATPDRAPAPPADEHAAVEVPARPTDAITEDPSGTAYSVLLDAVRAATKSSRTPRVVFAGAEAMDSVGPVVAGLAVQARRRGMKVLMAQLESTGERVTVRQLARDHGDRPRPDGTSAAGSLEVATRTLDVAWTSGAADFRSWLDRSSDDHDLVIIEAPPLNDSSEAALLGSRCDGLVIVVEPLATTRRGLRSCVARAKEAGCTPLGLVVSGRKDWLPRWLDRLLPDHVT